MYKNIFVQHVEQMRENFFKKLRESGLSKSLVEGIIKHYNREYAQSLKKTDQKNISEGRVDKRVELNVSCERDNKGIEWRAFNLLNVKTWSEFYTLMNIGYDCLEDFIQSLQNTHIEEELVIQTKKIPKPHSTVLNICSALKRFKRHV
jgi:hypothetical protein